MPGGSSSAISGQVGRIEQDGAVIRRIWAWALLLITVRPNRTCPTCSRPVVAPPDYHVGRHLGPMIIRRTDAEIAACCPVHGTSPANDNTVAYERRRDRARATQA